MTLYTKYRPTSFADVMGNEAAVETLQKALEKENHSHVYLLSGPPGTGKTTIARIMASLLGAGEMDIREINTATNRGIDTAREIMSSMRLYPMDGKAIVYILDECHKFTNDMQNALLKPLEDTPEHVYFFLCTTDPQKLIKAIRSRCTEVKTASLDNTNIYRILRRVNKLEEFSLSKEILDAIADASEGSPRKALVFLERVSSIDDDAKRLEVIKSGVVEEDEDAIELCRALLSASTWTPVAEVLCKLRDANKLDDVESIRYLVLSYMNSVLMKKSNKRAADVIMAFAEPMYNSGKAGLTLACYLSVS